jgi:hypothetical protein
MAVLARTGCKEGDRPTGLPSGNPASEKENTVSLLVLSPVQATARIGVVALVVAGSAMAGASGAQAGVHRYGVVVNNCSEPIGVGTELPDKEGEYRIVYLFPGETSTEHGIDDANYVIETDSGDCGRVTGPLVDSSLEQYRWVPVYGGTYSVT